MLVDGFYYPFNFNGLISTRLRAVVGRIFRLRKRAKRPPFEHCEVREVWWYSSTLT